VTERARQAGWQAFDSGDESELPPWAGPAAPVRPGRAVEPEPPPTPGRSRAESARRRRWRRRILVAGGAVAVAGLIAVAWYYLSQPSTPSGPPLVQTLQQGEYARAPNACRALPASALSSYLSGTPRPVLNFAYPDRSSCSFTVDAKPVFRVLSLTLWAYQPYLGAPGNGSATDYARYAFAFGREQLAKPQKHAPWPPAIITPLYSFGSQAFSALQVLRSGTKADQVTVTVRYRNVLITVSLQAQEGGGFGPVPVGVLETSAANAARRALTAVQRMPT
jgi:hypothetical protein